MNRWLAHWRADTVAGLTAAAVVIPKAMAYATIAGLPVQVGLFTVFIPMVIYAGLGTSRPMSVSTTTTIAILSASALGLVVPDGDAASLLAAGGTLALLVGVLLALASVLKLGFVANFISEPVLTGFKSGIGVVILVDQLPKLLGFHIPRDTFLHNIVAIVQHLPQTSLVTLALALVMFALIFSLEHFLPRIPAPLVVIAVGIAASAGLQLPAHGVETIGAIPGALPVFVMPRHEWLDVLWPSAAAIALMSFTETVACGRAFAAQGEPRPVPDRELLALGVANAVGGLFGAMPAGGGATQTAVNRNAGAQTQLAGVVTAAVAVATLLVLAPWIAPMPQATLAAIVMAYSLELVQPGEFLEIRKIRKTEFYWALAAFAGVMVLGTLKGILVAVIVSLLSLAQQAANPPVYVLGRKRGTQVFRALTDRHPDDETFPGLLLLRVEGRLFFANVQRVGDKMRVLVDQYKPTVIALDCGSLIDLEYTALKMLAEAEETLAREGITLWLVALNPAVLRMIRHSPLGERLGNDRLFFKRQDAVDCFLARGGMTPRDGGQG